jgi:hypothetical protein
MRKYKKILFFENSKRLDKLLAFREMALKYFNNSQTDWRVEGRIEQEEAGMARVEINRNLDEIYEIILAAGIDPSITYRAAPVAGGYRQEVDLIHNIFLLSKMQIGPESLFDYLERTIGKYEKNHSQALWRTFNPFFYVGCIFDYISSLPFFVFGKLGFNRRKAESSGVGKFIKGIFYLLSVLASFLAVLNYLGLLDAFKKSIGIE